MAKLQRVLGLTFAIIFFGWSPLSAANSPGTAAGVTWLHVGNRGQVLT